MLVIISDTHNHNWSVFSHTLSSKVNSRLQTTLDETWEAAKRGKEAGARALIHCGDMFHVRGSIAPSVLNPTLDLYAKIVNELDLPVYILAGNHDLEGNDSEALGNAGESLVGSGAQVISSVFKDDHGKRLFVPYFNSCNQLRDEIKKYDLKDISEWVLFIHAPLNGVIAGIPDHGLSAAEVQSWGFKAVFCGHYHNHKVFPGNVCSVGALTHQTFSDIGALAGFVLYDEEANAITHYPSNAPKFIDFDKDWDELEMIENITGNYVRVEIENASNAQIEEARAFLNEYKAAGTQIININTKTATREGEESVSVEAGASAKVSLSEWCERKGFSPAATARAVAIVDMVEAKSV